MNSKNDILDGRLHEHGLTAHPLANAFRSYRLLIRDWYGFHRGDIVAPMTPWLAPDWARSHEEGSKERLIFTADASPTIELPEVNFEWVSAQRDTMIGLDADMRGPDDAWIEVFDDQPWNHELIVGFVDIGWHQIPADAFEAHTNFEDWWDWLAMSGVGALNHATGWLAPWLASRRSNQKRPMTIFHLQHAGVHEWFRGLGAFPAMLSTIPLIFNAQPSDVAVGQACPVATWLDNKNATKEPDDVRRLMRYYTGVCGFSDVANARETGSTANGIAAQIGAARWQSHIAGALHMATSLNRARALT